MGEGFSFFEVVLAGEGVDSGMVVVAILVDGGGLTVVLGSQDQAFQENYVLFLVCAVV